MDFFLLDEFIHDHLYDLPFIKRQYLELLSMLTTVEYLSDTVFFHRIKDISKMGKIYIGCLGKLERNNFKIIASGTVIIEPKIIRSGKSAAHIEDIVVHEDYRGMGISQKILNLLKKEAEENNCYKIILDCKEELIPV